MTTHPARMLKVASDAVIRASAVCRAVQRAKAGPNAITKGDKSPVTIADFASQAVVAHALREAFGDVVLLAEEGSAYLRDPAHAAELGAALDAARLVWPAVDERTLLDAIDLGAGEVSRSSGVAGFWTLDPIDGTKGFLRGEQYAVCLAYIALNASGPGEPVIAALACPNLSARFDAPFDSPDDRGMVYLSERGAGVWALPADGSGSPVRVNRTPRVPAVPLRQARSVDASHSDQSTASRAMARLGGAGVPLELDSQCKYAVVARGQADIYLRIPGRKPYVERIWDHASGALIAAEAGCSVTDVDGKALDFSHGRGLEANRGVVCAEASIARDVLAAVRAAMAD